MAVNLIDSTDIKVVQDGSDIKLEYANIDSTTSTSSTNPIENQAITNYVDNRSKVIWTNQTPTSSFPAQDLLLEDMSEYNYYEIIYKIWTGSNYQHSTGRVQVGASAFLSGIEITPNSNVGAYQSRKIDFVSNTQLHFNDCYVENVYTNASTTISTSNAIMIPIEVRVYK